MMNEQDEDKLHAVREAIEALAQYGLRECTAEANQRQSGVRSASYAFEGPGSDGVFYFCETADDVLVLLGLVRSESHERR
jgi:hypothetical protein